MLVRAPLTSLLRTRPRVQRVPGIPCALCFGRKLFVSPGRIASRECGFVPRRHCKPTGRANARPMTGSAKQSILSLCGEMDCFVAALLAMTERRLEIWLFEIVERTTPVLGQTPQKVTRSRGAPGPQKAAAGANFYRIPSVAGELGFEPRQTESESVVLPLHHSPILPSRFKHLRFCGAGAAGELQIPAEACAVLPAQSRPWQARGDTALVRELRWSAARGSVFKRSGYRFA